MIIVDLGNVMTRVTNTETGQVFSCPTVVGYTTHTRALLGADKKDIFVGAEALKNRSFLTIQHPLINNRVQDLDSLSVFIRHAFLYEFQLPGLQGGSLAVLTHAGLPEAAKDLLRSLFYGEMAAARVQFQPAALPRLVQCASPTALSVEISDSGVELTAKVNDQVLVDQIRFNSAGGRRMAGRLVDYCQGQGGSFFNVNSENDYAYVQEHFYNVRRELQVPDAVRRQILADGLDVAGPLFELLRHLPPHTQAQLCKHLLLCGGVVDAYGEEAAREAVLGQLRAARAPFVYHFLDAQPVDYARVEPQLERFWETYDQFAQRIVEQHRRFEEMQEQQRLMQSMLEQQMELQQEQFL